MVKKKKRSFMSKLFSRRILLLIQFIVSIIFLGCIYILKMLPMKYYLILCGIIFLLWMLSSLLIKSGIKKKKRENKYARLIFGKLLSLILSIALGFVSVMAFKGNNFLSNITGSFTQTRVICMYVKKESAIKSLRDVKDNTEIGIASEKGSKNITSAIAKIENKANKDFQTKDYKDYSLLGDAIMDGDIDVIVAGIMLAVLIIPMGIIALAIRLDSPGPVFFRQARVTQYGRIFRIYKFRTMVDNASKLGAAVTVDNDSRITKVGAFLRKYRMDEFPQLFNILAGDMTLVGTRPEVPKYVKKYTKEMYATLLLPAGLTSRTSIAYKDEDKLLGEAVDEKSTDNIYLNEVLPAKMRYNLESMKHFGVKADAAVLWDTFTSVVGSERMTVKK